MIISLAMHAALSKVLAFALTAGIALAAAADAAARTKKPRQRAPVVPPLVRDYDGTPIIMRGYRRPRPPATQAEPKAEPKARPERPHRKARRGSGGYVPPPVPSPGGPNSPPPAVLLQPPPAPYQPPPIRSFGDRAIDAIHAYPLDKGIGNNPTDPQMFIRQRANQP
jgi:hypothetical protein